MSLNQTRGGPGRTVEVTAPTGGYTSGQLVALKAGNAGWVGEAADAAAAGETAVIKVGHEAEITKNTGGSESFGIGDVVYRDASTGAATVTATSNDYVGRVTRAAATAATKVWIQFAPTGA